ncbi:proteolipid protein 2 isoform X1 [Ovis aries]|uniref:Proteolipid protein 2 n=1 Tax=Ovis aries TaxID=9940 RepID=A0AC11BTN3_SHEEP|nr:proteolipid protein 2 isoform X1 [Ovis aries]
MADSERLTAPGCWAACTSFSRTRKGFLLFAEIILCLVILICFSTSTSGYSFLSVIEMIFAAVFFVVYMCDLHTKIQIINWPWSDFFRTLVAVILYLITSIVVLVERGNNSKIAAGVKAVESASKHREKGLRILGLFLPLLLPESTGPMCCRPLWL